MLETIVLPSEAFEYCQLGKATFSGDFFCDEATFSGDFYCNKATFSRDFYCDEATFSGDFYCDEATFSGVYAEDKYNIGMVIYHYKTGAVHFSINDFKKS